MYRNYYAYGGGQVVKNFLVIGLGSMGKRRVRCLQALGVLNENIYGIDTREDRCIEAKES